MWVATCQHHQAPRGGLQMDRQTPAQEEAAENGGVWPCPRAWRPRGFLALVALPSPDGLVFGRRPVRVYFLSPKKGPEH